METWLARADSLRQLLSISPGVTDRESVAGPESREKAREKINGRSATTDIFGGWGFSYRMQSRYAQPKTDSRDEPVSRQRVAHCLAACAPAVTQQHQQQ